MPPATLGLAALPLLAVLLVGCSGDAPTPAPSAPPAQEGWSLVPSSPASQEENGPDGPFDLTAANQAIRRDGYQSLVTKAASGPLRAIESVCRDSGTGRCLRIYFFLDNRMLGSVDAGKAEIVSQDGHQVRLKLPQYSTGDSYCCPTGEPRFHRATADGGKLTIDPPVPSDANGEQNI
ncbi:hypothetical protein ACWD4K_13315 [Streptomyces gelaticus]